MSHPFPPPVERACCCPTRPREPGTHTPECEATFRAKFLAAVQGIRDAFYGRQP